jgi:hypothetical protein
MKIDHTTTETAHDGVNRVPFPPKATSGVALSGRRPRTLQPRANQLAHDIRAICRRNPEGAQRTQADRLRTLLLCMRGLDRRKKAVNLHADDIRVLVHQWHAKHLASSTIRFRLHCLRWLARKIAKPEIVGSDQVYGVDRRMT